MTDHLRQTWIIGKGEVKPTMPTNQESGVEGEESSQVETPEVDMELEQDLPVETSVGRWAVGLSCEDWSEKQEADVLLKRLRYLRQHWAQKSSARVLKDEDPMVHNYCKHWGSLRKMFFIKSVPRLM